MNSGDQLRKAVDVGLGKEPIDLGPARVYADWLLEQGAPAGEMLAQILQYVEEEDTFGAIQAIYDRSVEMRRRLSVLSNPHDDGTLLAVQANSTNYSIALSRLLMPKVDEDLSPFVRTMKNSAQTLERDAKKQYVVYRDEDEEGVSNGVTHWGSATLSSINSRGPNTMKWGDTVDKAAARHLRNIANIAERLVNVVNTKTKKESVDSAWHTLAEDYGSGFAGRGEFDDSGIRGKGSYRPADVRCDDFPYDRDVTYGEPVKRDRGSSNAGEFHGTLTPLDIKDEAMGTPQNLVRATTSAIGSSDPGATVGWSNNPAKAWDEEEDPDERAARKDEAPLQIDTSPDPDLEYTPSMDQPDMSIAPAAGSFEPEDTPDAYVVANPNRMTSRGLYGMIPKESRWTDLALFLLK